jgi:hypothetical protein
MNWGKAFAYTQALTCFAASICYFAVGNIRFGFYWLLAGCLTVTVTV